MTAHPPTIGDAPVSGPIATPAAFQGPRTAVASPANKKTTSVNDKMTIEVQKPAAGPHGGNKTPVSSRPESWGVEVLPKPHTRFDGSSLIVRVMANNMAALSASATTAAAEAAASFGLIGRPVIKADSRPMFPLDPTTYEQIERPVAGCKWGKDIQIVTY